VWDEQGVKEYRRKLEEATFEEQEVEKMAAELKEVVEKATTKKEVTVWGSKGTGKKKEWWDRECKQSKNEVVKALREWTRNKIDRSRFLGVKRRYRERCREKKKQKREREEKEIKEIRTEREVWKYINQGKEKGISERGNNNARMGRVLYETGGREKRRRDGNTNEGEADSAGGNRNHSGRGGKTDKELEKEKGTGEGRGAK
jgi:hypothetical protein